MKSKNNSTQIFDPEIVSTELEHFSLGTITDIDEKRKIVSKWVSELNSGRVGQSKEEEIKPRFLNDLFGDVLGYAFGGAYSWNARPEFKSLVDAKKADAGLGFFALTESGVVNDVLVVVEIKDFNTDIDHSKNNNNQNAIEQAFAYAHKTKATWVIVSNFQEIRLYNASFSGEFEVFNLKDLNNENEFKRFIMLLHRQSLIDGRKSKVSKLYELQQTFSPTLFSNALINPNDHIIDQLWKSLKRFNGLESIDPYVVANIAPFNILDEYVWHYDNSQLFTLNPKIYHLLKELEFETDGAIRISDSLKFELETAKIESPEEKLTFVFNKLRMALVSRISAINNYEQLKIKNGNSIGFSVRHSFSFSEQDSEGISKIISITDRNTCECINCAYRNFNFKHLLRKLKQNSSPTLETAFGNFLVAADGYKKSFDLYEAIISETEGDRDKRIEYFLANYNQHLLFNLISWYDDPNREAMLKKIKSIDLDELLYTKFIQSDRDIREALKELRDDRVLLRVKTNADELLENLKEAKKNYDNDRPYPSIGNYTYPLHFYLCHLYSFIHKNYLVNSAFTNYQNLVETIIEGLIISHSLEKYPYRLQTMTLLHLTEATLFIPTERLEQIIGGVAKLDVSDQDLIEYLKRVEMFHTSHVDESIFNRVSLNPLMAEFLLVSHFKDTCARVFANTFLLLSKMNLRNDTWNSKINTAIIKFLKVQDYLYWYHLNKLGKFLKKHGDLFSSEELKEILIFANKKNAHDDNSYQTLIRNTSEALQSFFPGVVINEESFVLKSIADASEVRNHFRHIELVVIYKVVSAESQQRLKETLIKHLDLSFSSTCYTSCVHEGILEVNCKNYFEKYVNEVNASKGKGLVSVIDHVPDFHDYTFYNLIIFIKKNDIPPTDPRLRILTNLSPFERWLLDPVDFNYDKFDPEWLIASNHGVILNNLRGNLQMEQLVHQHLQNNYSQTLANIYFSFLAKK